MVQLSKAGMRNNLSLKGGHPPAVKAGGKRVVKKNSEDNGTLEKENKKADKPRSLTTFSRMQQMGILMAGPLEKLGHDFPRLRFQCGMGKSDPV